MKPRRSSEHRSSAIQLNLYMGKLAAEFIFSGNVSSNLVPVSEKRFYLQICQLEEAGEYYCLERR